MGFHLIKADLAALFNKLATDKIEKEELCPHCGYYCTGKTVFCTPPKIFYNIAKDKNKEMVGEQ